MSTSITLLIALAPIIGALLLYLNGRYTARQSSSTTLTTSQIDANQSDRDQLRQERAQLLTELRAEKAALALERDYWRGIALEALGAAEKATDTAARHVERPIP